MTDSGRRLLISALLMQALLFGAKEPEQAQTVNAIVARGQSELRSGQHSAALVTCDRALRLNIDYAPAYICEAQAYEGLGQSEAALQSIGQALQLDPALVEARQLRAHWRLKANRVKEAVADWDILESSGNFLAEDRLARGRLLAELGRYEESVKSLSLCIDGATPPADAFLLRAAAYREMKRPADAIRDLNEYLHRKPEDSTAVRDRFWLRTETGDAQGALDDYRRLPATERSTAEIQRARAWAAATTGENAELMAALTAALEKEPDHAESLAWRARILFSSRNFREAESDLTRLITLRPTDADAYLQRGAARSALKKTRGATEDFERAAILKPGWTAPQAALAAFAFDTGAYDRAFDLAASVVNQDPANSPMRMMRATILLTRNQYAATIEDCEAILHAAPDNVMAERLKAQALLDSGRAEQAIVSADRLLRLAPKSVEGHVIRANALRAVGRDREADAEFELYRSLRGQK